MSQFREEVVNVQLADALVARGLDAQPETISRTRQLPDVIVDLGGLKLIIEGRNEKNLKSLKRDAARRISDGLADISIAVAYDPSLMSAPSLAALRKKVDESKYSGSVFSFAGGSQREESFHSISLDELADLINSAFRLVVKNDVVREQVKQVETMIESIVDFAVKADLFFTSDVLTARLHTALGISRDAKADTDKGD